MDTDLNRAIAIVVRVGLRSMKKESSLSRVVYVVPCAIVHTREEVLTINLFMAMSSKELDILSVRVGAANRPFVVALRNELRKTRTNISYNQHQRNIELLTRYQQAFPAMLGWMARVIVDRCLVMAYAQLVGEGNYYEFNLWPRTNRIARESSFYFDTTLLPP